MNFIKKIFAFIFLLSFSLATEAQNITGFEYFFDVDPGIGLATAANPPASPTVTDFSIPLSVSSLSTGFHTLYIRGKNTANQWTHTQLRPFYIVSLAVSPDIAQIEYFIDTDPGFGLGTQVSFTAAPTITNLAIDISASSLSTGFHILYVRSKSSDGTWTHTQLRSFYIVPLAVSPNIAQIEYFIDTDPGFGLGTQVSFTAAPTITNLAIDISAVPLTQGFHKLYVRSKSSDGKWTHTQLRSFYIANVGVAQTLVKFEYFFDNDPGFDSGIAAAITPAVPSVTNQDIFADVSSLTVGTHTINVRAKDSGGEWTQVGTGSFSVTAAAVPTIANFTPTSGPAGTTVTITGTNFTGATTVNFGGTAATSFTVVNATTVTAVVGTGTSGNISLTTPGGTATSSLAFTITPTNTITISSQPTSTSACDGATAFFVVAATGTTNLIYQWQKFNGSTFTDVANGSGFSGATSTVLTITTAGTFDAGNYRCKVSGDFSADVFTNTITLVINSIPVAPTTTGASGCSPSALTLTATGGTSGQYRWHIVATGGTAIAGQTNASYTTNSLTATTTYYVSINNGTCESVRTTVVATITGLCLQPPVINTASLSTTVGGSVTIDLKLLITTSGTLDVNSIQLTVPPTSGAVTSIKNGVLTISYQGVPFAGKEIFSIRACDTNGNCSSQQFEIEVAGDVVVYNALSPSGANPLFIIQYIDLLPETKNNSVTIFDRWQNEVWKKSNYNNTSVVFSGASDSGTDLPTGIYFYKIEFASGRKTQTGFISLKR